MPETLLSPSNILLYGRVLQDLAYSFVDPNSLGPDALALPPPRGGQNRFLQQQLADRQARLARIYGFSYEGHYYDLPKPAIFLVHGAGHDPEFPASGVDPRLHRQPADVDRSGVAGTAQSGAADIKVWAYDKGDYTIRLDVETGPFEQVLLEALLQPDRRSSYSGAEARISGAEARISGAEARISGAEARLRARRGGWSD